MRLPCLYHQWCMITLTFLRKRCPVCTRETALSLVSVYLRVILRILNHWSSIHICYFLCVWNFINQTCVLWPGAKKKISCATPALAASAFHSQYQWNCSTPHSDLLSTRRSSALEWVQELTALIFTAWWRTVVSSVSVWLQWWRVNNESNEENKSVKHELELRKLLFCFFVTRQSYFEWSLNKWLGRCQIGNSFLEWFSEYFVLRIIGSVCVQSRI